MLAEHKPSYHDVLEFVKTSSLQVPPYDINGVIHLLLAALDNLNQHWVDYDLQSIGEATTESQRQRLIQIGRFLETFTPEDD